MKKTTVHSVPIESLKGYHDFEFNIDKVAIPERFNFPFYYEPHQLCILAAEQVQRYLVNQTDWKHNFGLNNDEKGLEIGKMFGVLVVQKSDNSLGFLSAFSGKLANSNNHNAFVPPVFDMLTEKGFFKKQELVINSINAEIDLIEGNKTNKKVLLEFEKADAKANQIITETKNNVKEAKKRRQALRKKTILSYATSDYEKLKQEHTEESIRKNYELKDLIKFWKHKLEILEDKVKYFSDQIDVLKTSRKQKSHSLQQQLFEEYKFLNAKSEYASLLDIFSTSIPNTPPAGAGECAAPKLLHYAYLNGLKPLAIAEFWWGKESNSNIRKQGLYYPACRTKCEPILKHMLQGLQVDLNPMLENPGIGKQIKIVFEDEHLMVINKPPGLLSVPGKNIEDSVYARIRDSHKDFSGPIIVHRLDMSTSGIMILAKKKQVHKSLQNQFIRRKIEKRYFAKLDGELVSDHGTIDLPLRVDLDNRPHQMVCYEHGRNALTTWEVVERSTDSITIHFFPHTGRTHQLRVHAAHPLGLNLPIIGDDLYGKRAERLYLHAEWIKFWHPSEKKFMEFTVPAEF